MSTQLSLISSIICLITFTTLTFTAAAHQPPILKPGTDILLFKIASNDQQVSLTFIENISPFDGYDNQPVFTPDNRRVLYVSARNSSQTDVYQYDIASRNTVKLTATPESEYSPFMTPGDAGFYAVREGGEPYQSLHHYHDSSKKTPTSPSSRAVKSPIPIGYYAINKDGVIAGWARWAHALYLFQKHRKEAVFVTGHVAPSRPFLIPRTQHFSFVHRQTNGELWIKSLNPENRAITPIVQTLDGNMDYAWTPEQQLLTAKGRELYLWQQGDDTWHLWTSLSQFKIFDISRLAISNDFQYIAIVARVPVESSSKL